MKKKGQSKSIDTNFYVLDSLMKRFHNVRSNFSESIDENNHIMIDMSKHSDEIFRQRFHIVDVH